MTKPLPENLKKPKNYPYHCDICDWPRGSGDHKRCSKIRQQRHADMVRNEELDRLLMFDKKE